MRMLASDSNTQQLHQSSAFATATGAGGRSADSELHELARAERLPFRRAILLNALDPADAHLPVSLSLRGH